MDKIGINDHKFLGLNPISCEKCVREFEESTIGTESNREENRKSWFNFQNIYVGYKEMEIEGRDVTAVQVWCIRCDDEIVNLIATGESIHMEHTEQ